MKARLFSTVCLLFVGAASSACGSSDGQVDDEPVAVSESALSREALKPYFLYWFLAEDSNKVQAVWAFHNPLSQSFTVTDIRIRDFTVYTWQIPTIVPVPAHTDVIPGFFWLLDYRTHDNLTMPSKMTYDVFMQADGVTTTGEQNTGFWSEIARLASDEPCQWVLIDQGWGSDGSPKGRRCICNNKFGRYVQFGQTVDGTHRNQYLCMP